MSWGSWADAANDENGIGEADHAQTRQKELMARRGVRSMSWLLQERAMELFVRQGFDGTTFAHIADAAGVSHMTFFRYFPTKESVVFGDPYDPLFADLIAAQNPSLPALERVRRGLLAGWTAVPKPTADATRAKIRLIAGHPRLAAGIWENNRRTEDLIVSSLAATGVDRVEARVAAGACLGGLTVLDGVSLEVGPAEINALVGRNGAGRPP